MKSYGLLGILFIACTACNPESQALSGAGQFPRPPGKFSTEATSGQFAGGLPDGNPVGAFLGNFKITSAVEIHKLNSGSRFGNYVAPTYYGTSESWQDDQNKGVCEEFSANGEKTSVDCIYVGKVVSLTPYFVIPKEQCTSKAPAPLAGAGTLILDACMNNWKKDVDGGGTESVQFAVTDKAYDWTWQIEGRLPGFAKQSLDIKLHDDGSETLVYVDQRIVVDQAPDGDTVTYTFELRPVTDR
jgi:hypothetical protein